LAPLIVWLDSILVGFTIIMVASGLALVFGVMGILNWTHGQLYMMAAYIVFSLNVQLGLNYVVSLAVATVVIVGLGILLERVFIRPVADKGFLAASVVTMGLLNVFLGIVTMIFGPRERAVPIAIKGKFAIGSTFISYQRLTVLIIALLSLIALYWFVNRSRTGLAVRAAAQDKVVAGMYAIRVGRLFVIVMAVGCGLAALAGGLLAPVYSLNPLIGGRPLNLALLAIVLGGMGSFKGAAVGGLILGFASVMGSYYIGAWWELVQFMLIIVVIMLRPQGLFGKPLGRAG